jgi:hypothetical protein
MISKKVFCETLKRMEELDLVENSINDIFRDNKIEFNQFSYCEYEDLVYNVLVDAMGDEELGWICYWIFDLNFGHEYDDPEGLRAFEEDNSVIELRTAENLYDYLVKTLDNQKKV